MILYDMIAHDMIHDINKIMSYNRMQYDVIWYGMVWYDMKSYNMI